MRSFMAAAAAMMALGALAAPTAVYDLRSPDPEEPIRFVRRGTRYYAKRRDTKRHPARYKGSNAAKRATRRGGNHAAHA